MHPYMTFMTKRFLGMPKTWHNANRSEVSGRLGEKKSIKYLWKNRTEKELLIDFIDFGGLFCKPPLSLKKA